MAKEKIDEKAKQRQGNSSAAQKKQSAAAIPKNITTNIKPLALAILAVIVIVLALYYVYSTQIATPFPTFLVNFKSASRIAISVNYGNIPLNRSVPQNESQLTPCATSLVQMITGGGRSPTTIDFFDVNGTTCSYLNGFGTSSAQISTTSAAACISIAKSEPSIFLNYSATNSTYITPYHLYVDGNANYMAKCGIAVDMAS